ncbi:hypothetical protein BGZ90_002500 [Linnemannia elongata]|nr:hypothetical protein BGZ90_002500 [Linnemannia elongata]
MAMHTVMDICKDTLKIILTLLMIEPMEEQLPEQQALEPSSSPISLATATTAATGTAAAASGIQRQLLPRADGPVPPDAPATTPTTKTLTTAAKPKPALSNMTPTGRERKPPRTPKPKKQHACPECSRIFTRRCNLQSHRLTHTNLKPFPCPQCGQSFARIYDMRRHHRIHGQSEDDKPYKCPMCPQAFRRIEPRVRHMLSTHGVAVGSRGVGGHGDAGIDGGAAASMTSTSPTGDSFSSPSLQSHPYDEEYDSDEEEDEEMELDTEMKEQQRQPLRSSTGGKEAEYPSQAAPFQARGETEQREEKQRQSMEVEQQ